MSYRETPRTVSEIEHSYSYKEIKAVINVAISSKSKLMVADASENSSRKHTKSFPDQSRGTGH